MSFHPKEMGEEPLLRFKLVNWNSTGETSLSIAFCHILGESLYSAFVSSHEIYKNFQVTLQHSSESSIQLPITTSVSLVHFSLHSKNIPIPLLELLVSMSMKFYHEFLISALTIARPNSMKCTRL